MGFDLPTINVPPPDLSSISDLCNMQKEQFEIQQQTYLEEMKAMREENKKARELIILEMRKREDSFNMILKNFADNEEMKKDLEKQKKEEAEKYKKQQRELDISYQNKIQELELAHQKMVSELKKEIELKEINYKNIIKEVKKSAENFNKLNKKKEAENKKRLEKQEIERKKEMKKIMSEFKSKIDEEIIKREEIEKKYKNEEERLRVNTENAANFFIATKEKAITDFFDKFIGGIPEYVHSFVSHFLADLKIDESIFFKDDLCSMKYYILYENKIKEISENIDSLSLNNIIMHLNVYLIGLAGVGKSTLINALLQLTGENEAEEGIGSYVTKFTTKYISDKVPWLRLYDTRGIEIKGYGISDVVIAAKKEIQKSLQSNNPDDHIHAIWYLVTGDRFETAEKDALADLMNAYEDQTLPIVVVYTKATNKTLTEIMVRHIERLCSELKKPILKVIPIMAKPFQEEDFEGNVLFTRPAKGLDELLKISQQKIGDAVKSSCYESLRRKIQSIYNDIARDSMDKINMELPEMIDQSLKVYTLNNNTELKECLEKTNELFSNIILSLLKVIAPLLNSLDNHMKEVLANYIQGNFLSSVQKLIDQFTKDFVDERINRLAEHIQEIQTQTSQIYGITLPNISLKDELYEECAKEIIKRTKNQIDCCVAKEVSYYVARKLVENLNISILLGFDEAVGKMKNDINEKSQGIYQRALSNIIGRINDARE